MARDSVRLPFGKFKGLHISDPEVNAAYLALILERGWVDGDLFEAVRDELAERLGIPQAPPVPAVIPTRPIRDAARRIIQAGFRRAALEAHPDRGGTDAGMVALTDARDWLQRALEVGVAA